MEQSDITYIQLKEGSSKNYMTAYQACFGGEINKYSFEIDRGFTQIRMTAYPILPEFEIITSFSKHNQTAIMDREPDDNPDLIHINVIKEGLLTRNYNDKEMAPEADTSKGIFIYNGLFPMKIKHPARVLLESVSYKFSRKAFHEFMPEATEIIEALFGTDEPMAYHTHLPAELDVLVEDIFHFKKSEFGRHPLVIARSLELFTLLLRSVRKLVDKDELQGLHIDDYQRLLKIKDHLLSSFDQRISVEDLAAEYGISRSKLKRDFKTLFDTSVYQFYAHAKMDEAYRRLQTGKYTVMEVGYDLGYQNISKFSQMFKKVKGINPKDVMPV